MTRLKREIQSTSDGSKTLSIPEWNESYHSKHGALQEAKHVFFKNGIELLKNKETIHILEYGFGTGLNCFLSMEWAFKNKKKIIYHSLEKYPISRDEWEFLEYHDLVDTDIVSSLDFEKIHLCEWDNLAEINDFFSLKKIQTDFKTFFPEENFYDIIFFDAFGKRVQPELWTVFIFEKIYNCLKNSGLFTTYASNGSTQRALKEVGFLVEKKPGPPGKREMLNAWKN